MKQKNIIHSNRFLHFFFGNIRSPRAFCETAERWLLVPKFWKIIVLNVKISVVCESEVSQVDLWEYIYISDLDNSVYSGV